MEFDYINALSNKKVSRTPIWIMRQAGRYLPEYQATRKKARGFMNLCKNPHFACEVTMQPLMRYDLDAAILFSDILTIPDAMGLELNFIEGQGPKFNKPINNIKDIARLPIDINDDLDYVFNTVMITKKTLANKLPLIGFAGSPWTLATYMIEGGSSKNFHKIKKLLLNEQTSLETLLNKLTTAIINYLEQQIKCGVDAIMIFDTWAGVLSPSHYLDFSLKYMKIITQKLKLSYPEVPITLFSKNGGKHLNEIIDSGCNCIAVDWTINLAEAYNLVDNKVALQGNLDPAVLTARPQVIENEVIKILKQVPANNAGYVFNLGHGITPDIKPENVEVLVNSVHNYKQY